MLCKNILKTLIILSAVTLFASACSKNGHSETDPDSLKKKQVDETCSENSDCENGLYCIDFTEKFTKKCADLTDKNVIGAPCKQDYDCSSGFCKKDGRWGKLGGYCSRLDCKTSADCANSGSQNSSCLIHANDTSMCVSTCLSDQDCRNGFLCQSKNGSKGACIPTVPSAESFAAQFSNEVCKKSEKDKTLTFDLMVPPNTKGYTIRGRTLNRSIIFPVFLRNSLNDAIERFDSANNVIKKHERLFVSSFSYAPHFMNLLIPLAPQYESFVRAGNLQVGIQTAKFSSNSKLVSESDTVCFSIDAKRESSQNTLDLNIYLVGPPSMQPSSLLTRNNAPQDVHLQTALNRLKEIYAEKEISIGAIHYFDPSQEIINKYKNIKDMNDIHSLLTSVDFPPVGRAHALNIFIVNSLSLSSDVADAGSTVGISSGMPGFTSVHKSELSGVVIDGSILIKSKENCDDYVFDPNTHTPHKEQIDCAKRVGKVMAHEIGHFLGLFHTSETFLIDNQDVHDLLSDTQECSQQTIVNGNDVLTCKDISNLMFPFELVNHAVLSDQQANVIKSNPLTH